MLGAFLRPKMTLLRASTSSPTASDHSSAPPTAGLCNQFNIRSPVSGNEELDDLCGIPVLLDGPHNDTGLLGAAAQFGGSLEPAGRAD